MTSWSHSSKGSGPSGGFRIGEVVGAVGSVEAARGVCGACPANAFQEKMAGCCGWLGVRPEDEEFDGRLRAAIAEKRLEGAFAEAFPRTTPVGYGLWIGSPLTVRQAELLAEVIADVGAGREGADFRRACRRAARRGIPLHVKFAPLGHTDFGYVTTFPHCPRFKKLFGEEWDKPYTSTEVTCAACGERYVPAATAKSEEMKEDEWGVGRSLEEVLPAGEYAELAAEWTRRRAGRKLEGAEAMLEAITAGRSVADLLRAEAKRDTAAGRGWRWVRRWLWGQRH